ncbi:hypothetical protein [Lysobacter sp. A3-1-A15]|uniref:hypothetical protein n=1 Tax=Novilysobacter viscosus TaxID=3098602 RepID=UPI002EDAE52D
MKTFSALAILLSGALVASCSSVPLDLVDPSCGGSTDIPDSRLLIFGELHGTEEAPALVGQYVCRVAKNGREVVVGLEIDSGEQERLDSYLRSPGSPTDRLELLAGPFWQRPGQDGRSSRAMLNLVERLRATRATGGNIRLVAIDQPHSGTTRDAAMAAAIRAALPSGSEGRIVVLIGNYHASRAPRTDSSTAFLLSDLSPTTIGIAYRSGTAWVCDMGRICGDRPVSSKWAADRLPGFHDGVSPWPGYDGTYLMDRISASPPAKQMAP